MWTMSGLLVLGLIVFAWSLSTGSVALPLSALLDPSNTAGRDIFWTLRWPRALAAFAVGGLLGMSGLLMQVLLRNPLADPYILGVSGGAGLGGVLVGVLAGGAFGLAWPAVGAGLGASLAVLVVFGLNVRRGLHTLDRLLLTGVAVSSLCTALVSLVLTFVGTDQFRGLVFWLLGELDGQYAWPLAVTWLLMLLVGLPLARAMNAMALGDELAQSLGLDVKPFRWALYWLSALATGVAVAAGGMIGFVGLVVPHALRLLLGFDHRLLWPAVALAAGLFLLAADTLARTVLAPIQLPVGVVTALIGAPVFIALLLRGSSGHKHLQATPNSPAASPSSSVAHSPRGSALLRILQGQQQWQGHAGQVWAILGNSGVGKSTLLRQMAGLPHWAGVVHIAQVWIEETPLSTLGAPKRAQAVAWMPQSDELPFACTVSQRVLAGRYAHGSAFAWESAEDRQLLQQALSKFGLQGRADQWMHTLSGGERRRVSLACAWVQQARVMLLDEPLSQLDWAYQTAVAEHFHHLAAEGRLVVWVTHDPNMALRYATHALALTSQGEWIQGTVDKVVTSEVLSKVYGCDINQVQSKSLLFPA